MKKLLFLCLFYLLNFISLNAQWEPCNKGLRGGEINGFIIDGKNTYAAIDGGVFMTTDNGDTWIAKNNGLKGLNGFDILSIAISGNYIFAGTWYDGIFLSTDKGENWVQKSNGLPYWINHGGIDSIIYDEHINTITISGNNIFAGTGQGVFLSTNNGDNWIVKNNGIPTFDSIYNAMDINSIVINGNNIFAGTRYGIFLSNDNGDNWIARNYGLIVNDTVVYSIAINGINLYAGTWYGLYLSTNNGGDWEKIGVVDSTIVNVLIVNKNYIIAGGHGLYLSKDNGNSWTAINLGLTYLSEITAIINSDYIFAGTNNSGIFRAKLSDIITGVKETNQNNESIIYPNPASSSVSVKYESSSYSKLQISIFDLLGNEVFNTSEDCNIGMNEKVIDCHSLVTGYYIIRLKQGERVEAKPVVIVRN
ncbi:MAG: T9SS type A sorting domain-containing protein [FCB group bacterium]